jgi:hypothetical protein
MYVLSFSDFVRRDDQGSILVDSRKLPSKPEPGQALWSTPLAPHTLHNAGEADLRVISIEIKDSEPKEGD